MGVEYIYVEDGIYESGGKNCNVKEAKMCVKLLKKHMMEHPNRSLGIIAFSENNRTPYREKLILLELKIHSMSLFLKAILTNRSL